MAEYKDYSARLAWLDKEIDRLEDMGGHDTEVRGYRREFQHLTKLQAIWNRKQKYPRLFAKMRAAADTTEAKALADALLKGGAALRKPRTQAL